MKIAVNHLIGTPAETGIQVFCVFFCVCEQNPVWWCIAGYLTTSRHNSESLSISIMLVDTLKLSDDHGGPPLLPYLNTSSLHHSLLCHPLWRENSFQSVTAHSRSMSASFEHTFFYFCFIIYYLFRYIHLTARFFFSYMTTRLQICFLLLHYYVVQQI